MAELVDSPASFYVNASQFNHAPEEVDARIEITSREDILKRSGDWMVNIVRWTIDTQASLAYIPADPTASMTMSLFNHQRYTQDGSHNIVENRVFTLTESVSGLPELLRKLNQNVPQLEKQRADIRR